jgi:hypothetical protein
MNLKVLYHSSYEMAKADPVSCTRSTVTTVIKDTNRSDCTKQTAETKQCGRLEHGDKPTGSMKVAIY